MENILTGIEHTVCMKNIEPIFVEVNENTNFKQCQTKSLQKSLDPLAEADDPYDLKQDYNVNAREEELSTNTEQLHSVKTEPNKEENSTNLDIDNLHSEIKIEESNIKVENMNYDDDNVSPPSLMCSQLNEVQSLKMGDSDNMEYDYVNLLESGSEESDISDIELDDSDDDSNLDLARNWYPISTIQPEPPPPRFPFIGSPGCTFTLPGEEDVLAFFQLFFDDFLINLIITETNKFAEQQLKASRTWSPVTTEEMYIFFAMKIFQGIVKKPDEKMYWSTSEVFQTPIFPKLLSCQRYHDIQKNLHFFDQESYNLENHFNPKLNKIWPVFEIINNKCRSLYIPERDISVDESLTLYKGRLSCRSYNPLNSAQVGLKLYCLCESKSRYYYTNIIYTGKGTLINEKYKHLPMPSQIVMSLVEPLLGKGYCLMTADFFTSPQLADILIKENTDIFGIMRLNHKEVPIDVKKKKMKKGEIIAFQRSKVMLLKWKDKKDVCMLSTIHNPEMEVTRWKDKERNVFCKPKLVNDFNETVGGVNRLKKHLYDYPPMKMGKKYYKKIFFHLLHISVWNAFVLYQKNGGQRSNLEFRKTLVEKLIEKYNTNIKKSGRPSIQPGPLRLTERHFPEYVPPTEKKATPCRYCAVCCSKRDERGKKRRKETRFYCKNCNVGLCPVPCFKMYHTQLNF